MRTSNGFTAMEVILVLVVIATLGFAGWTWWSMQQAEESINTAQVENEKTQEEAQELQQEESTLDKKDQSQAKTVIECNDINSDKKRQRWGTTLKNTETLVRTNKPSNYQLKIHPGSVCELENGEYLLSYTYYNDDANTSVHARYKKAVSHLDSELAEKHFMRGFPCQPAPTPSTPLAIETVEGDTAKLVCKSGDAGTSTRQEIEYNLNTHVYTVYPTEVTDHNNPQQ